MDEPKYELFRTFMGSTKKYNSDDESGDVFDLALLLRNCNAQGDP
jgi:hypothetical protein